MYAKNNKINKSFLHDHQRLQCYLNNLHHRLIYNPSFFPHQSCVKQNNVGLAHQVSEYFPHRLTTNDALVLPAGQTPYKSSQRHEDQNGDDGVDDE